MKKLLLLSLIAIAIQAQAQNVGIGVSIPTARLHVGGGVKIEQTNQLEFGSGIVGKETNAGKIGYNAFGQNGLTIVGGGTDVNTRKLFFFAEGGISANGQLNLVGNPGVNLNASDNAMITRGFDVFTSGKHSTLGRWGLFMEPNRLTLGVPNLAGKGISFTKYNSNSTNEEILSIASEDGAVRRPAQGGANLLPIAYGFVTTGPTPVINSGTGNFTISRSGIGSHTIRINGHPYNETDYCVIVQPIQSGVSISHLVYQTSEIAPGGIVVITTQGNASADLKFNFIVFKP